ncbi:RcnB family protein [Pantoea sp. MBD-2R]|uniref:RcnB family protein n=1 Tax=unclassified Pantoea TaxID=2630326 RepID=UPI0011BED7FF|nr:RcnB family protein [Pantoea sp. CCBC3-3-1]
MSKSKYVLFSAMLFGAMPLVTTAYAEGEQAPQTQTPEGQDPAAQAPDAQESATSEPDNSTAPSSTSQTSASQAQSMQNPDTEAPEQRDPAHPYEIKYFFADFQRFTTGSVVPDRYRTKKYEIVDWKTRNLPAPDAGTNWTYMGGNYVLISKADGKILKAESGDIFYKQN